jgi:hypothetical protein
MQIVKDEDLMRDLKKRYITKYTTEEAEQDLEHMTCVIQKVLLKK